VQSFQIAAYMCQMWFSVVGFLTSFLAFSPSLYLSIACLLSSLCLFISLFKPLQWCC